MSIQVRWILGILAAVLVVCLVVWAHGRAHHEGTSQVDDKAAGPARSLQV